MSVCNCVRHASLRYWINVRVTQTATQIHSISFHLILKPHSKAAIYQLSFFFLCLIRFVESSLSPLTRSLAIVLRLPSIILLTSIRFLTPLFVFILSFLYCMLLTKTSNFHAGIFILCGFFHVQGFRIIKSACISIIVPDPWFSVGFQLTAAALLCFRHV